MIYQTTILATFIAAVLLLTVSKKHFILPFILVACFIPADQRVIIYGLDFTPLRMLIVIGFLRIILRTEPLIFKWNRFDRLVILWALCGAFVYVIQFADMRALIFKCGLLFDIVGLYWLFRLNINSWSDIKLAAKLFALCSLLLAILVGLEWVTGKNPFVIFGRVQTVVREGRYRCQAAFPHSIMLGLFWGTLFPIFIGLTRTEKQKTLYWAAAIACSFIVAATASSTPYLTLMLIVTILCTYRWRKYMRYAVWCLITSLAALHVIMTGPVWSLIAKVGVVPGSTGLHRFNVINQAIVHFDEWAIIGTQSTSHWGKGLQDLTNMYVGEGVRGGLITLILLLVMLYTALRFLLCISLKCKDNRQQFLEWCFFVSIVGHCIAFFGISYFGQMNMLWYLMLAWIAFLIESPELKIYAIKNP